jgi:CTP synthase
MIGKYLDIGDYKLVDSYISVNESLKHACAKNSVKLDLIWIDSKKLENGEVDSYLKNFDGIIVPGGFGSSGVEGKINAIKYCREHNVPFLGLCFGLQLAVVEYARNVCGLKDAHTTEVSPNTSNPVVDILPEQKNISSKGGTMRLGAYDAILKKNTLVHDIYGADVVSERHRHRYEVNPEYHEILQSNGLIFSGMSPNARLVEFIEFPNHKYFVGTQAHPEFKSSLLKPAPLFDAFIKSCKK